MFNWSYYLLLLFRKNKFDLNDGFEVITYQKRRTGRHGKRPVHTWIKYRKKRIKKPRYIILFNRFKRKIMNIINYIS